MELRTVHNVSEVSEQGKFKEWSGLQAELEASPRMKSVYSQKLIPFDSFLQSNDIHREKLVQSSSHLTHPELNNARIMITSSVCNTCCPIVYMDMLHFGPSQRHSRRHPHMIELLGVLVEDVRVAFGDGDVGDFVDLVDDVVECCEDRARLHVFVVVSGDDDAGERIEFEERFDEGLQEAMRFWYIGI